MVSDRLVDKALGVLLLLLLQPWVAVPVLEHVVQPMEEDVEATQLSMLHHIVPALDPAILGLLPAQPIGHDSALVSWVMSYKSTIVWAMASIFSLGVPMA